MVIHFPLVSTFSFLSLWGHLLEKLHTLAWVKSKTNIHLLPNTSTYRGLNKTGFKPNYNSSIKCPIINSASWLPHFHHLCVHKCDHYKKLSLENNVMLTYFLSHFDIILILKCKRKHWFKNQFIVCFACRILIFLLKILPSRP